MFIKSCRNSNEVTRSLQAIVSNASQMDRCFNCVKRDKTNKEEEEEVKRKRRRFVFAHEFIGVQCENEHRDLSKGKTKRKIKI